MKPNDHTTLAAALLGALLLLISLASLLLILLPRKRDAGYIADIFQNGDLIASIPLGEVQEPYRFTITGASGCTNEIEVRSESIGILSADCPDQLCVHQGFIRDSRLPITCLPNGIVILLRAPSEDDDKITPDTFTY